MKHLIILLLALISLGLVAQEKESKTQPKEVTLSKDSQSDKYGEVPFNHENHSIKKYSPDGQSVLSCVECHHTDQPAASLKPPLKTSERTVLLTTESLAAADAKPVKSCRACHLQAGDDSAPMPTVQYPDKPAPRSRAKCQAQTTASPATNQQVSRKKHKTELATKRHIKHKK
jgi:Zn-finger protein